MGSLLSCPHCDYTCHKTTRLNNHMNAVHLGVKPFHCDQCPSAFPNRFPILLHTSFLHKIFTCPLLHQEWVKTAHDQPHWGAAIQVPVLRERSPKQAKSHLPHQNTHWRKTFHLSYLWQVILGSGVLHKAQAVAHNRRGREPSQRVCLLNLQQRLHEDCLPEISHAWP